MDKLFLTSQTYTLLCKTDVERAEWKEAIIPLLEQIQGKKKKKVLNWYQNHYRFFLLIKDDSNNA